MNAPVRIQTRDRGIWFKELPDKLSAAVNAYDIASTSDWSVLDELSSKTQLEGMEVYGDSAVIDGKDLVAPGTVFVALQYDPKSGDGVTFHDSFPARVFFTADPDQKLVEVQRIAVDTASFFES